MNTTLSPNIQELYDQGCQIRDDLITLVERWPTGFLKFRKSLVINSAYKEEIDEKLCEAKRWLNTLGMVILPNSLYDKAILVRKLHELELAVLLSSASISTTSASINLMMNDTLALLKSVPPSLLTPRPAQTLQQASHIPRTAFILMWMDPSAPELDDVCNAIKDVCSSFNVYAFRADDVEHEDRITDVVLQKIADSEFLIADLTGERPNVYYEVGYAHALNKRPILYRRQGTRLHFDLSVHNVPEYKNITELKDHLHKRFEAILGHTPRTQFR